MNPPDDELLEADDRADEDDVDQEDPDGSDDPDEDDSDPDQGDDEPEPGYLWSLDRQERELREEYETHIEILDEMEVGEILAFDLSRASDYLVWAAAQSLEEQGRPIEAIDLLRRLEQSSTPHPALSYPEIRLRLHDLLRERGDYEGALAVLDAVERDHPDRKEGCRSRRAEVLVLSGRAEEGLKLFETAARSIPDDPWIPLAAAWALIRAGDYRGAQGWITRGERAIRRLEDDQEIRSATAEADRLRDEARARSERRAARAASEAAGGPGLEDRKKEILALLDAEEVALTREPPLAPEAQAAALARLTDLHRRASSLWDDAVERHEEDALPDLEDLQWQVVEVAERFGLRIPGTDA